MDVDECECVCMLTYPSSMTICTVVPGDLSRGFVSLPAGLRKLPDYRWVTMCLADRQNQHRDWCKGNLCQGAHRITGSPAAAGQSLGLTHDGWTVFMWGFH